MKGEDLLRETDTLLGQQEVINAEFKIMDEYQENLELRTKQFMESKNFQVADDDDEDDEYDNPTQDASGSKSVSLLNICNEIQNLARRKSYFYQETG